MLCSRNYRSTSQRFCQTSPRRTSLRVQKDQKERKQRPAFQCLRFQRGSATLHQSPSSAAEYDRICLMISCLCQNLSTLSSKHTLSHPVFSHITHHITKSITKTMRWGRARSRSNRPHVGNIQNDEWDARQTWGSCETKLANVASGLPEVSMISAAESAASERNAT